MMDRKIVFITFTKGEEALNVFMDLSDFSGEVLIDSQLHKLIGLTSLKRFRTSWSRQDKIKLLKQSTLSARNATRRQFTPEKLLLIKQLLYC